MAPTVVDYTSSNVYGFSETSAHDVPLSYLADEAPIAAGDLLYAFMHEFGADGPPDMAVTVDDGGGDYVEVSGWTFGHVDYTAGSSVLFGHYVVTADDAAAWESSPPVWRFAIPGYGVREVLTVCLVRGADTSTVPAPAIATHVAATTHAIPATDLYGDPTDGRRVIIVCGVSGASSTAIAGAGYLGSEDDPQEIDDIGGSAPNAHALGTYLKTFGPEETGSTGVAVPHTITTDDAADSAVLVFPLYAPAPVAAGAPAPSLATLRARAGLAKTGIDLALDAVTGDLVVDRDVYFTTGPAAVVQGIRLRLLAFLGEWFLDLDHGVPWFQDILGRKYDAARMRALVRAAIVAAPGVDELVALAISFEPAPRRVSISFDVRTTYGVTSSTVEF